VKSSILLLNRKTSSIKTVPAISIESLSNLSKAQLYFYDLSLLIKRKDGYLRVGNNYNNLHTNGGNQKDSKESGLVSPYRRAGKD
jgi:hypothetical protein